MPQYAPQSGETKITKEMMLQLKARFEQASSNLETMRTGVTGSVDGVVRGGGWGGVTANGYGNMIQGPWNDQYRIVQESLRTMTEIIAMDISGATAADQAAQDRTTGLAAQIVGA